MLKKILLLSGILFSMSFISCNTTETAFEADLQKTKVVCSIEPLREFAEIIGDNNISVTTMVKSGVEPHDYEPTSKDLINLDDSRVFFYNGLGMEEWVDKVINNMENSEVIIVNTSENTNIINEKGESIENYKEQKVDPHIWLSLKECKVQSLNIKNNLKKIDSQNSEYYEENYNNFISQIDDLYNEYKEKFDTLENKNFVTSHAAFGYLCRDFGLTQMSIEDLFGEGEVTPNTFKDLINFCKENNIDTIFMPEVASEELSKTLAKELSANVVEIYSLETIPKDLSYIEAMRKNLDMIYSNLSK